VDAERRTSTHDVKEASGFTNSVVPPLEEKMVAEHLPPNDQTDEKDKLQYQTMDEKSHKKMKSGCYVNGVANGKLSEAQAEAGMSAHTDDRPPRASGEVDVADEEEKAAPGARATVRKHLNHKTWALSTPKPRVVPEGFEDPISDAFWKNVWVASAVYNVRISFCSYLTSP
jgi:phospholipase D1/2